MYPQLQPDDPGRQAPEVGEFRQGTADSRRTLSGYLVGRAIGEQTAAGLMILGFSFLALAVGAYFIAPTWLAVLVGLIGFGLLLVRAVVAAVMRRLAGVGRFGPHEDRMRSLVAETRGDVRRELRRLGLPSHTATMPLLVARLLGRRRGEVIARLRGFDIDRVVPPARVDDVHLVIQALSQR